MYIDNNWFLSLHADISNPKVYTHTIAGQTFWDTDHLVLVRHKNEIKTLHRKELGKTMLVIRQSRNVWHTILPTNYNMLTLFSSYDENNASEYFFFPKINGEKLRHIAEKLDMIDIIDENKWRFNITQTSTEEDNLLYRLFILYTISGKSLIKGSALSSLKIQISIPTPFFSRKDILDGLIQELQLLGYLIAGYFIQQPNGWTYEINTSDYDILDYIRQHDKSLASVEKIVTKETADQVSIILANQYPESKNIIGTWWIKLFEVK